MVQERGGRVECAADEVCRTRGDHPVQLAVALGVARHVGTLRVEQRAEKHGVNVAAARRDQHEDRLGPLVQSDGAGPGRRGPKAPVAERLARSEGRSTVPRRKRSGVLDDVRVHRAGGGDIGGRHRLHRRGGRGCTGEDDAEPEGIGRRRRVAGLCRAPVLVARPRPRRARARRPRRRVVVGHRAAESKQGVKGRGHGGAGERLRADVAPRERGETHTTVPPDEMMLG